MRGTKRCKNQQTDRAYYSCGRFACVPHLYRLRLEVRSVNTPHTDSKTPRQYFAVTKVIQQVAQECTPKAVVALLSYVFCMAGEDVKRLLAMGGYDYKKDVMTYPPGETGEFMGAGFGSSTSPSEFRDRHLHKHRLIIEILEYGQEAQDATKNRNYILKSLELHYPETFKRMMREDDTIAAAYDSLLYSPELVEEAERQGDLTAFEQGQRVSKALAYRRRKELKDRYKIPPSVLYQRNPEVVRYMGAGAFQKLKEYFPVDLLFGFTVEEIYILHDLLFDAKTVTKYVDASQDTTLTGRARCRKLLPAYRLCFAPLMRETNDHDEYGVGDYMDVDFVSFPHVYTGRKTTSVAREMSIRQLIKYITDHEAMLEAAGEKSKPLLTEQQVMDVYLYHVIQMNYYQDKNESLPVHKLFERVRFDLGFSSMASLVDDQMTRYTIQNPKAKAARESLFRLLDGPMGGDDLMVDVDLLQARIYASVCRLSAAIDDDIMGEGRGNGGVICLEMPDGTGTLIDDIYLQDILSVADNRTEVLEKADRIDLGTYRVYLAHTHSNQQLAVEGFSRICSNFTESHGAMPTQKPFFELATEQGWDVSLMRRWYEWYHSLDDDEVMCMESDALTRNSDEECSVEERVVMALETPGEIVFPEHEKCPEQKLAELSYQNYPFTCIMGAAGSGKSALVAQLLQRLIPGTVLAMTFMLSHAHNLAHATGMKDPAVCTMDQFLCDHQDTCCNLECSMPQTVVAMRKELAEKKRGAFWEAVNKKGYHLCGYEKVEVIIFDEVGTFDDRFIKVLTVLRRCCPRLRRILFSGDLMQMEPIGVGHLARDIAYAFGTVPFEHAHRAGCDDINRLAQAINDNRPDKMELNTDNVKFFRCTAEAWEKAYNRRAPDNIVTIVKGLYREADLPGSRLAYLDSEVICHSRAMCRVVAAAIDLENHRRLILGPTGEHDNDMMAKSRWKRAKKAMTYPDSGKMRTGRFRPGQKIISSRSIRDIGVINQEKMVVDSIVKGEFLHMDSGNMAALYEKCFEHICLTVLKNLAEQFDPPTSSDQSIPGPIQKLMDACMRDDCFSRRVRNCACVDMKKYIEEQAQCQGLEATALAQFFAGEYSRIEVNCALRCSEGLTVGLRNLGYSWMIQHPLTVRRRMLVNDRQPLDDDPIPSNVDGTSLIDTDGCVDWLLRLHQDETLGSSGAFSSRVIKEFKLEAKGDAATFVKGPLSEAMQLAMTYLLHDAGEAEHSASFDGSLDASMVVQASKKGPCFHAIRRAAEAYYGERKAKVAITSNDYLSFIPKSSGLPHSGVIVNGVFEIMFLQCHVLGNPKKIVYIPVIPSIMNYVRSGAAVTFHGAQSTNAGTVIPVIPYPVPRKAAYTAVTRTSDGLIRSRREAGLGNNCWIVSNESFALMGTMEMTTMPRRSILGYKLRTQVLHPLLASGILDECEEELQELRDEHERNVNYEQRKGESEKDRDRRVRTHGKHYGFTMPWNQVVPARCFGDRQMEALREMQDSLPMHMYDEKWRPTPQLMTREEYAKCEWDYREEMDCDAYLWESDDEEDDR